MNEIIPYLLGLSPVAGKELCARFDGGRLSSDGGVLLFPGIERRLGIANLLASCAHDERDWPLSWPRLRQSVRMLLSGIFCFIFYRLALLWVGYVAVRAIQGKLSDSDKQDGGKT